MIYFFLLRILSWGSVPLSIHVLVHSLGSYLVPVVVVMVIFLLVHPAATASLVVFLSPVTLHAPASVIFVSSASPLHQHGLWIDLLLH